MPLVDLRAGAPHPSTIGDTVGTTVHTSTQTYSNVSALTVSFETFTNRNGRAVLITGTTNLIIFEDCTFRDIADLGGVNGGYRFGLIRIDALVTNVIFRRCRFENISSVAWQAFRNDLFEVYGTGFLFEDCHVDTVWSDQSQGSYASGDEGNRVFYFGSTADQVTIRRSTFVGTLPNSDGPGRNWAQFDRCGNVTATELSYNVVIGAGWLASSFEDMLNFYLCGGVSAADPIRVHHNYMANGGSSTSGTAVIFGDGDVTIQTAHVWAYENYIVDPGFVGMGIYGGNDGLMDANVIYARGEASQYSVGMYLQHARFDQNPTETFGTPDCRDNTVSNNRVWFVNSQSPGGVNHFWNSGSTTNPTITGNTWGDGTLTFAQMTDVTQGPSTIAATVGVPLNYDLKVDGASWTLGDTYALDVGESTPPGLTLNADGTVTGTPTGSGGTFDIVVTNAHGNTATATVTVNVSGGVSFEITNPPDTATGVTNPQTSSGTGPVSGDYQVRHENGSLVDNGTAWVTDTDPDEHWLPASWASEAWTADDPTTTFPEDGSTHLERARYYPS